MRMPWLTVSILAGVGYFLTIPWHPFPGSIVLKGLSVSALAAIAWNSALEPKARRCLTAALALSSLGDILLDFKSSFFVFGLGSFLLAHVLYIRLFLTSARGAARPPRAVEPRSTPRRALAAGVIVFTVAFSAWLLPTLGALTVPVVAYIAVLAAMVLSAIAWRTQHTQWILYGAILFLISDSVLGAAKFRGPVPLRGWIVWGTYYAAQFLIASGVLRELEAGGVDRNSLRT
jgi:uncharacterized membrane protein YhhN